MIALIERLGGGRVPVRTSLASACRAIGTFWNLLLAFALLGARGDGERVAAATADGVGEGLLHVRFSASRLVFTQNIFGLFLFAIIASPGSEGAALCFLKNFRLTPRRRIR